VVEGQASDKPRGKKPRGKNAGGSGGTALWGFKHGVVVEVAVSGSGSQVWPARAGQRASVSRGCRASTGGIDPCERSKTCNLTGSVGFSRIPLVKIVKDPAIGYSIQHGEIVRCGELTGLGHEETFSLDGNRDLNARSSPHYGRSLASLRLPR